MTIEDLDSRAADAARAAQDADANEISEHEMHTTTPGACCAPNCPEYTDADAARAEQDFFAEAIDLPWDDADGDPSPISPAPAYGDVHALVRDYADALDSAVIAPAVERDELLPPYGNGHRIAEPGRVSVRRDLLDAVLLATAALAKAVADDDLAQWRPVPANSRPSPGLARTDGEAANPGAPASHQDHPLRQAGEADARLDAAANGPAAREASPVAAGGAGDGEVSGSGEGPDASPQTAAAPAICAADAVGKSAPPVADNPVREERAEPQQPGTPDPTSPGPGVPGNPDDDPHVWVATRRRGISYHAVAGGDMTGCGRPTRAGEKLRRSEAEEFGATPCRRCTVKRISAAVKARHNDVPARRDPEPAPGPAIATPGGPDEPEYVLRHVDDADGWTLCQGRGAFSVNDALDPWAFSAAQAWAAGVMFTAGCEVVRWRASTTEDGAWVAVLAEDDPAGRHPGSTLPGSDGVPNGRPGPARPDTGPGEPDPLAGVGDQYEQDPAARIAAVAKVAPQYVAEIPGDEPTRVDARVKLAVIWNAADRITDVDPAALAADLDDHDWKRAATLRDQITDWFDRLFTARPEPADDERAGSQP